MAAFIVRVELHQAISKDYDELHKAMEKAGFSRQIQGSNGAKYHLPTAQYELRASLKVGDVLQKAQVAANSTGKKNAVLVSEYVTSSWSGLAPVQAPKTPLRY